MKKVIGIILILSLVISISSCGTKEETKEENQESVTEESVEESEVDIDEANEEGDNAEGAETVSNEKFLENKTKLFQDSDYLAEVEMGVRIDGVPTTLLYINLPTDCYFGGSTIDEAGIDRTEGEIEGQLTGIIERGGFEKYLPASAVIDANEYFIQIHSANDVSIETEEQDSPGGIKFKDGEEHEAYIYEFVDAFGDAGVRWIYRITDDWTLTISCNEEILHELGLETLGNELYNIITPIK